MSDVAFGVTAAVVFAAFLLGIMITVWASQDKEDE